MVFFRSWREEDESCMTYACRTIVPKQVLHAFREDGIFTETSNGAVEEYPGDFGMHLCLVEILARAQELDRRQKERLGLTTEKVYAVKGSHGEQIWREAQRSQARALPVGDIGPHEKWARILFEALINDRRRAPEPDPDFDDNKLMPS